MKHNNWVCWAAKIDSIGCFSATNEEKKRACVCARACVRACTASKHASFELSDASIFFNWLASWTAHEKSFLAASQKPRHPVAKLRNVQFHHLLPDHAQYSMCICAKDRLWQITQNGGRAHTSYSIREIATQPVFSVDRAGWQAN